MVLGSGVAATPATLKHEIETATSRICRFLELDHIGLYQSADGEAPVLPVDEEIDILHRRIHKLTQAGNSKS